MSVLQVSSLKVLLKLGNLNLVSDIGISALLLISSIKSSLLNIKINTNSIESIPEDILLAEFSAEEALKELESLCLEVKMQSLSVCGYSFYSPARLLQLARRKKHSVRGTRKQPNQ